MMLTVLLEPFTYDYMQNAIIMSGLVGAVCGIMSAFLVLKGWALVGDALSHAIVPGVAVAGLLGLPFSIGALFAALLAALTILFLDGRSGLKPDAIIGCVYISFFGLGLFLISLFPLMVDIRTIMLGNILSINPDDSQQLLIICLVIFLIMGVKWRDFMLCFFNPHHAHSIGIQPRVYHYIFFILLSVTTVAAMQTVGAFLVVAMVIIPGATAYLLCDRFGVLLWTSLGIGLFSGSAGAYISYYADGATGGIIVLLQTLLFVLAFLFTRQYGRLMRSRLVRQSSAKIRATKGTL